MYTHDLEFSCPCSLAAALMAHVRTVWRCSSELHSKRVRRDPAGRRAASVKATRSAGFHSFIGLAFFWRATVTILGSPVLKMAPMNIFLVHKVTTGLNRADQ